MTVFLDETSSTPRVLAKLPNKWCAYTNNRRIGTGWPGPINDDSHDYLLLGFRIALACGFAATHSHTTAHFQNAWPSHAHDGWLTGEIDREKLCMLLHVPGRMSCPFRAPFAHERALRFNATWLTWKHVHSQINTYVRYAAAIDPDTQCEMLSLSHHKTISDLMGLRFMVKGYGCHKSPKILSSKNFYYLNSHVNKHINENTHTLTLNATTNVVHKSIVSVFSSLRRAARQLFHAPTNISNTSSRYQHHTPSTQPKRTRKTPTHLHKKNTLKTLQTQNETCTPSNTHRNWRRNSRAVST